MKLNNRLRRYINTALIIGPMTLIMAFVGVLIHAKVIGDFQPDAFEMWIACIPIVAFFAPLGAFVISKLPRKRIAQFLYCILVIQFFGAMLVIKPSLLQLLMCAIVLASGLIIFTYLAKLRRAVKV